MLSRYALAALVASPLAVSACAQLLSYDDYSPRADKVDTGAPALDSSADTAVNDTAADAPDSSPKRPPTRPAGAATPSGKGRVIWVAAKRMWLGSLNSLGAEAPEAWKEWGYDIDNTCTGLAESKANIGTCKRPTDANQDSLIDGNRCLDNNFGHHVIGLIKLSSSGFEQRLVTGLLDGDATWLVRIDDLDDGVDDGYAPAKLYRTSAATKGSLKWDGTDLRDVLNDAVLDGSLEKSRVEFPKGYVKNNVWVSGEPEFRTFVLPLSETVLVPLTLDAAVLTLELDADHKTGKRGTLAGAIPVSTIDALLYPLASSSSVCPGTGIYQSLWNSMQRFPDVVIGAPNLQDTTLNCNGISFGVGIDFAPVQPATKLVPSATPPPDPCDAGVKPG